MFCTSCGSEVKANAKFCARCGTAVDEDAPGGNGSAAASEPMGGAHGREDTDATVLGDEKLLDGNLETLAPDSEDAPRRTPIASPTAGKTPLVPPAAGRQDSARATPGRAPFAAQPGARTPSAAPMPRRPQSASNPMLSSDAIGGGRFTPGDIIVERYRIVALLGRGGMGEVYRAEDLKLSQVVAIKFLPAALSQDESILARFHSEVRIARQVSHPNVCRVFDIGDADGVPFLTMEYVDGEDLSSLVRRIGRLPQDKAVEVSRQICAGLAAAHDRGVVHRDLKPSNLMLDGSGKIRITDFGLAAIAANIQGAEVRAGTPAYMAPEQLSGKEVTIKSDIYALGLVMYEILTGKRAYAAATLAELVKARDEGTLTNPSAVVRDLDPLLERVVMRCLEKDPAKRPASALLVAAALPGGDPLAAALAAGETPSPEMVAAAGETEGMRPSLALACLLGVFAMMAVIAFLAIRESGLEQIHPQNPPEVLAQKAREIAATLGYPGRPQDKAYGFEYNYDYLQYLDKKDKPGTRWNQVVTEAPPVLGFWYRESPREMLPYHYSNVSLTPGVVGFGDPQATFSGMVNLRLDLNGHLQYFQAIPPEKEEYKQAAQAPDWQPLFAAAGLNAADFHTAPPAWNTLASSDARAAWDGTWPGSGRLLHVEAAAWQGKYVFFQLSGPWTNPSRMLSSESDESQKAGEYFGTAFAILLVSAGIWLAYRNYSRGKGDRRGAWRLATAVFFLELLLFLLWGHLSFSIETLYLLLLAASTGLFMSGFLWTLYIALEPYVRSKWPQTIVSWSRLLAGKVRDPLVGRDVLLGTLLGLTWTLVYYVGNLFDIRAGQQPFFPTTALLEGARPTVAFWFGNIMGAITGVLLFFFTLVFLRVLLRNKWVAAALFVALFSTQHILQSNNRLIDAPVWIIIYVIAAFAVVRFGLIVLATAMFTADILLNVAFTRDFGAWFAPASVCVVVSFLVIAAWGYYEALAGQKLFKEEMFE